MPTILLTILLLASFSTVHAHPVIFKEGIVLSSSNMESYSDNQVLYSFSHRWAAGANHWRFSKDDNNTELGLGRLNHLLWRHNGENSQANIYLSTGLGVIDSELGRRDTREVYMGGFEIDWETRTLFTALKHYQFSTPALTDISMTQVRIGISPYEAPFENLQSWFMLQAMLMPEVDKSVILTPMVRFFYHNVLWEVGSSTRGEWMLNLMVHI